MNDRSIAITGMACVFPGAKSLEEFWCNIVNGVDSVTDIPAGRMNRADRFSVPSDHEAYVACKRGGFLPADLAFEPIRYGIMPNIVANGDPDQFVMLDVAAKALADASVDDSNPIRETTDVIIGRGGYLTNKYGEYYLRAEACDRLLRFVSDCQAGTNAAELVHLDEQIRATFPPLESDSISTCMPNLVASRVANRLNLQGAAYTVDAACASSLIAIEQAVARLRSGQCDLAVAGGIHLAQIPSFWFVFSKLGALSPTSTIRPFDRRADGLVPSEGCGAVVLKRLGDACRDGDRIYAVIRGSGSSSDGRDAAVLAPSSSGQVRALRRAYHDAQVDPATIGYLEAHGTGTQVGDATEVQTIKSFFGIRGRLPSGRGMGSIKSMIGHAMPAAGIASLIKTALALSHKILPASLHCEEPRPDLDELPFFIVGHTRPWIHQPNTDPRRAGVSALGFGGSNAHVVLEEVEDLPTAGSPMPRPRPIANYLKCETELLVFSGESRADVIHRIEELQKWLTGQALDISLSDLARSLVEEFQQIHSVKAACIGRDIAELVTALPRGKQIVEIGDDCINKYGWYFTTTGDAPRGKIACIFPGVGFPGLIGNYPDHLMELCLHFPEVRAQFDAIELRDRHPDDPVPTSVIFAPPSNLSDEQQALLRERIAPLKIVDSSAEQDDVHPAARNIASSGITMTNWVSWVLLEKLGIPADMICGQSMGEIAGLCASGVLDITEIIPRFWDAMALSPTYAGKGRLAFVHATEEQLSGHVAGLQTVAIAIHVAPQALVLGGVDTEIETLIERLRDKRILSQALPYPPIHTPQLNYFRDELMKVIDTEVTFGRPRIPVYSAVTEEIFPQDEEGVRRTALANLDRPVRFWQTIHRMYAEGARIFIQVGGGSLAANIKSVLDKPDIVGTAVDVDYRDPITQLNHLCATLIAAGVKFPFGRLFEHRPLRSIDWKHPQAAARSNAHAVPLRFDWCAFDSEARESRGAPTNGRAAPNPTANFESSLDSSAVNSPFHGQPASHKQLEEQRGLTEKTLSNGEGSEQSIEQRMPFVGSVLEHVPGERITIQHQLDIDEDLYLCDHVFVQARGVKPPEECLPVMPLTMILEAMAEAAACLAPGLGVIGFENVQAQRWVALENSRAMPIVIQAQRSRDTASGGPVHIRVKLICNSMTCAFATVVMADRYRHELDLTFHPLMGARAWPYRTEEIYRDGHLFHGPAFQCISELLEFADNGCTAWLTVQSRERLFASTPTPELVTDPVILDAIGQLAGLWAVALGVSILPSGLEKLEFYRPLPSPGSRILLRAEIVEVDPRKRIMKSQVEALDAEGHVWFRVAGWRDWLYRYPEKTRNFNRKPCLHCISAERLLPRLSARSVCREVSRADVRDVTLTWLERLFLNDEEVEEFRGLKLPKRQWEWMLGRIAAKDAIRVWHARESGSDELLHPVSITVAKDDRGRPFVRCTAAIPQSPTISISHSHERAIAVASDESVGIDLEAASAVSEELLASFCRDDELENMRRQMVYDPQGAWPARLWAAKEAAGKAIGTGLIAHPTDFALIDCEPDGQVLIRHEPSDEQLIVFTQLEGASVIAYTSRRKADALSDAVPSQIQIGS